MRFTLMLLLLLALSPSTSAQWLFWKKPKSYADSLSWAGKAFDKGQKRVHKAWKKNHTKGLHKAWKYLHQAGEVLNKDGRLLHVKAKAQFLQGHYLRAHQLLIEADSLGANLNQSDSIIAAQAWHKRYAFEQAVKAYQSYLSQAKQEPVERIKMAQERVKQAQFARQNKELQIKARVDTFPGLPENQEVFFPLLGGSGSEAWFYFIDPKGKAKLWYAWVEQGKWQGETWDIPKGFVPNALSADGQWLLLTGPGIKGSQDLYFSRREPHAWARPQAFPKGINTRWNEAFPSLDPLGQQLVFSSNRPGGAGGMDLYLSRFHRETGFAPPQRLNERFNSPEDELAPRFHYDGKTIYFASSGFPSLGGIDLFSAHVDHNSPPTNLGYPINTSADDIHLSLSANGQLALVPSLKNEYTDQSTIRMISLLGSGKLPLLMVAEPLSELSPQPRGSILENPEQCVSCAAVKWWTLKLPEAHTGGNIVVWDAISAKELYRSAFYAGQSNHSLALPAGTVYYMVVEETQRLPRIFVLPHLRQNGFGMVEHQLPAQDEDGICLPVSSGKEELPLAWIPIWEQVWSNYLDRNPKAYLSFELHPNHPVSGLDWLLKSLQKKYPRAVLEYKSNANQPENCLLVKAKTL